MNYSEQMQAAEEIVQKYEAGEYDERLGRTKQPEDKGGPLTRADLSRMSPEQIDAAHTKGRFDDLFNPVMTVEQAELRRQLLNNNNEEN